MSSDLPFVSIIVPTRDRSALLADCLTSLKKQDYPSGQFEIVVVDDGSRDSTPAVVRRFQDQEYPAILYIRQNGEGPNAARNAGIARAKGDPICLLDDDVEVPGQWLTEMVRGVLRHPEAGAVGGRIHVRFEGNAPRFCGREALVGEAEFDLGPEERSVREVISANMAVRRWALDAVGRFDESLPIYGDELEWERRLERAGHPIVYLPTAVLWHRRTDVRFSTFLKRYFRRGVHYVAFARRVGDSVSVRGSLRTGLLSLAHATRRSCAMGIFMMAQQLGILWALASRRMRGTR